jgi:hypothetical protein
MAKYLVESYDWELWHAGVTSQGALGEGPGSEKIYLHVIEVGDDEIRRLAPRVDEHGNREHDRLALPSNEEWWIPVDGKKAYPKTFNPKIISRALTGSDGVARAQPLDEEALGALKKAGAKIPA